MNLRDFEVKVKRLGVLLKLGFVEEEEGNFERALLMKK